MKSLLTFAFALSACSFALHPSRGNAQEAIATATPIASASSTNSKLAPLTVTAELLGGTKITGTIVEVATLPIKTAFGEATVPLSEIAGVKMASSDDTSTTIIMKNGDSITGATDLKFITVDTEWGTAKINGSSITSMLMIPDLKWSATMGLNGRRWSLIDAKTATPPANAPTATPANPRASTGSTAAAAR